MATEGELTEKFWKSLKSDRYLMLGLPDVQGGHGQPMTAVLDDDLPQGPIWFFTSSDTELFQAMGQRHGAMAHFASKGHDLFASLEGELVAETDRAMVDRLWSPFVAAWYPGGKDDPRLRLLRFEPAHAQIWLNENNVFAGLKLLLGRDPRKEYAGKVADVPMGRSST